MKKILIIALVVILVCVYYPCGSEGEKGDTTSNNSGITQSETESTNNKKETRSAIETISESLNVSETTSNSITPSNTAKSENNSQSTISSKPIQSSVTTNVKEDLVFRTPKGKRYHLDPDCGGKNSYIVTLKQAKAVGLTPCQKCAS